MAANKIIKNSNTTTILLVLAVLCVAGILYTRYNDKQDSLFSDLNFNDMIQKYLAKDESSLADDQKKKPILWIPICYETNARNWLSFGSRNTTELNHPYLYLTVKTIISRCNASFNICIIDDDSFGKLLPTWNIDMSKISSPVTDKIRQLGMMKILYKYGGMIVPPSFLCMRDLTDLYSMGTSNGKMFVVENNDRNSTSVNFEFYPDLSFCGAPKETAVVGELIDFIQRTISSDYTAESVFLGEFSRWINVRREKVNIIDGKLIGVKTMHDEPILVDNLLNNSYIDLYPQTYGIYIPSNEILSRRKYEWFARMSPRQVVESKVILGKYILLANAPDAKQGVIEPLETLPNWVSYWRVPSGAPLWGLKPNDLGNHLIQEKHYDKNT